MFRLLPADLFRKSGAGCRHELALRDRVSAVLRGLELGYIQAERKPGNVHGNAVRRFFLRRIFALYRMLEHLLPAGSEHVMQAAKA